MLINNTECCQPEANHNSLSHSAVYCEATQSGHIQAVTSLWLAGHFLLKIHDLELNLLQLDIAPLLSHAIHDIAASAAVFVCTLPLYALADCLQDAISGLSFRGNGLMRVDGLEGLDVIRCHISR